ncbi:MAG: type II toxin-antitoxin system VapC family toxin [Cyanobacteria bacterium]|nr:type II toxin-antitoxin system VapC family toxin [Cyanobacteriota bacterium]
MIIDSSALIAILRNEAEAEKFENLIYQADKVSISSVNFLETAIIIDSSRDPVASRQFDDYVKLARIEVTPVSEMHANIARQAYRDFGKGSGHPAQLNFGDCFAYALARESGEPILFKGNDFSHTDLEPADL